MAENDIRERQKSLINDYKQNPEAAQVTLTATAEEQAESWACSVDVGRANYDEVLPEEVGGPGTAACPGDQLLGSLAACSQITAQLLAERLDIDADISVEVSGDGDVRGEMGIDDEVPVGFQDIRLTYP